MTAGEKKMMKTIRTEYSLADYVIKKFSGLISIGNRLMARQDNVYVDVEEVVRKYIGQLCKDGNLSSTLKNKVMNNLHDELWTDDEELFSYEDWVVPFKNGIYDITVTADIVVNYIGCWQNN